MSPYVTTNLRFPAATYRFVDAEVLRDALARVADFSDKRLSLTDCASFEVMSRLGLTSAFSFDRDFRDCGFQIVP